MSTFTETQTLHKETCCNCHVLFAMPEAMHTEKRRDRTSFYCPNGHAQHFTGPTPESELRDKLATAEMSLRSEKQFHQWETQRRERAEREAKAERMGRLGERSAKVRLQQRIINGVCPCCRRSFKGLHEHIKKMHPEFAGEAPEPAETPERRRKSRKQPTL